MMRRAQLLAVCALATVCWSRSVAAEDFAQYRDFALGRDLAGVAAIAGVTPADAKTLHQRPALLQELEWRPVRWTTGSTSPSTDPLERIVFNFYNDQLFRMVVEYSAERTAGMTPADIVEALSAVYGAPQPRATRSGGRADYPVETEAGAPIARWGNGEHSVVLYQGSSYRASFRLILSDVARAELARKADAEALRLDDREAPQREAARQAKERDDERAASAKTRATNKAVFQP